MDLNKDTIAFSRKSFSAEKRSIRIRRLIISIVAFSALSVLAGSVRYRIPFTPSFIALEFSLFFELISSIAYGPLIGLVVCVIKSAAMIVFSKGSEYSIVANFFVETVFICIAGGYYFRKTFAKNANYGGDAKKRRRKRIFNGGIIAMPFALIIQYVTTLYYVYPRLQTNYAYYGYSAESMLKSYADSANAIASYLPEALRALVPEIKEMWQGVLLFNISISLIKMLIVVLAVMLIYPYISNWIHFRKKNKAKKENRNAHGRHSGYEHHNH